MSRHGYGDDCYDQWAAIRYQGAVKAAIRGKRGQAFLRELRNALDAMPEKALLAEELVDDCGECCALGSVAIARGLDVSGLDPEEFDRVAETFGISESLAREIMYENDEGIWRTGGTSAERWRHMRKWVERRIVEPTAAGAGG